MKNKMISIILLISLCCILNTNIATADEMYDTNGALGVFISAIDDNEVMIGVGNVTSEQLIYMNSFGQNFTFFLGDWNGDGRKEFGVYGTQENYFIVEDGTNDSKRINLGWPGVIPLVGDWNGSGIDDVGVFDPTTAMWALGDPANPTIIQFGPPQTSVPIVGDWDGDGIDEIGIYAKNSNCFVLKNDYDIQQINLGWSGVIPVVGDWNGDGIDDVGVFDPTTAMWALGDPANPTIIQFGPPQISVPLVGDWNEDGNTDIGVFCAETFFLNTGNKVISLGVNGIDGIPIIENEDTKKIESLKKVTGEDDNIETPIEKPVETPIAVVTPIEKPVETPIAVVTPIEKPVETPITVETPIEKPVASVPKLDPPSSAVSSKNEVRITNLDLRSEYVVIRNFGTTDINLSGWTIRDEGNKHSYTFPRFNLGADKSVTFYTFLGTNSGSELYWGRQAAVWNNEGDTASLYDNSGNLVSSLTR